MSENIEKRGFILGYSVNPVANNYHHTLSVLHVDFSDPANKSSIITRELTSSDPFGSFGMWDLCTFCDDADLSVSEAYKTHQYDLVKVIGVRDDNAEIYGQKLKKQIISRNKYKYPECFINVEDWLLVKLNHTSNDPTKWQMEKILCNISALRRIHEVDEAR